MTLIVIQIRSTINSNRGVRDTLKMLNITRVNHCSVIPNNLSYKGMLQRVKDYVTWGEIGPEQLAKLMVTKGTLVGGGKITDAYVKENTEYGSIMTLSKAICEDKINFTKVKGVTPIFRLPPPRKGYEGIKKPYASGGAAGNRRKNMHKLVDRMIPLPAKAVAKPKAGAAKTKVETAKKITAKKETIKTDTKTKAETKKPAATKKPTTIKKKAATTPKKIDAKTGAKGAKKPSPKKEAKK